MEGFLTKDAILASHDLPYEDAEVPEWGGKVRVRVLTGAELDKYHGSLFTVKGKDVVQDRENFRTKLLVKCLIDDKGNRLFNDKELEDLAGKSGAVLQRLYEIASRLNGMTAEEAEVLEKNSA